MRGRRRNGWLNSSSMFSPNPDYRAPGTEGGRKFQSTEHLAAEAISAFVDGELRMSAHLRAAHHASVCSECAAEIDAQTAARKALRQSGEIKVPGDLLGALNQIPTQEIDLRRAPKIGEITPPGRMNSSTGRANPLAAPGFPVHRPRRKQR